MLFGTSSPTVLTMGTFTIVDPLGEAARMLQHRWDLQAGPQAFDFKAVSVTKLPGSHHVCAVACGA